MISSEKKFRFDAWTINDNIKLMKDISNFLQTVGCFKHGSLCEVIVKASVIHEGNER